MTDQIEFSKSGEWVVRITADRRIEVNDDVTVTEAAQTVLEALQTLLEQPEQEPQPCPTCEALARTVMMDQTSHDTAPPQRKPLTDADIKLVMNGRGEEGDDAYIKPAFDPYGISEDALLGFVRAIEQAHGIGGKP